MASVSGGKDNTAGGSWASVTGGNYNTAGGDYSSISGGEGNTATANFGYAPVVAGPQGPGARADGKAGHGGGAEGPAGATGPAGPGFTPDKIAISTPSPSPAIPTWAVPTPC